MKPGTRVKMSETLKRKFIGQCADGHRGPFEQNHGKHPSCWGCSTEHVLEFGNCVGIVQGPAEPQLNWPEVDVRWQPSNLRYAYLPEDLDVIACV